MSNLHPLPTITITRTKNLQKGLFSKLLATLTFYVSLFLLTFSDFINAQFAITDRSTIKLGLFSGIILTLPILVGSAFLLDKEFRHLLLGKIGILYGFFVVFYALMGWRLVGNNIVWIREDLLVFLWPIGGMAMFSIVARSYRPKQQLASLIIVLTVYIYYAISLQADRVNALSRAGLTDRITDWNTWSYSALLLSLTGIALAVLCRQGWFWLFLILGAIALHLYSLGFLGATRSVVLSMLSVLIFSIFGLSYRVSNGVLTTQSSLKHPRRLIYLLFSIGIFLLIMIFFINVGQMFTDLFENNLIFERAFNPDKGTQRSSDLRIEEAIGGIQSFQDELEFIFGRGLGSTFFSVNGYEINAFHIGILTFLLKGGLILFSYVVFILYVKLPRLFIKSLLSPRAFEPLKRTALLTVLPGAFGWAVLLLISGGYSTFNSLGVGFSLGAYFHIKKHGLGIFFE